MKTIQLLKDLIAIPSYVDGKVNEFEISQYIRGYFQNLKYVYEEQLVEGNRYNLIFGNAKNPQIVILGHMDTVLPKKETTLPFLPRMRGNKLFGLGTLDMKAGLAIMMSIAQKIKPDKIAYVFTCDEEYEFKGALKLAKEYSWKPKIIINLEPTSLLISNGCRGITEFTFDAYGKAAHASRKNLGVNAIEKAISLTSELEKQVQKFDDNQIKTSLNVAYLYGGVLRELNNDQPLLSGLGMVVPDFARVNCEIRIGNQKISKRLIIKFLNKIAKELNIKIKNISFKFIFGMFFTPTEKLKIFEQSIKNRNIPTVYRDLNSSGFNEVQMLQKAWNCDAVVFGPGPIEMAHSANEYVNIDSVYQAESILEEYLKNML